MEEPIGNAIRTSVLERFLRYVQIHSTSAYGNYPDYTGPSTPCQWDLLRVLRKELLEIGLEEVELDDNGYLYGVLPATKADTEPICFLSHVDTSPDQSGEDVRPQLIEHYDGRPITYPDDSSLSLRIEDCEELKDFMGDTIITPSGRTLLGADDKAGIAEIVTALEMWKRFPDLPHTEVRVCFTRDEEIGRGVSGINLSKLPRYCYTVDGGPPGEIECECFDAWKVELLFKGHGVHPGAAYEKMVNAVTAASFFAAALPREESPERTREREGFYHILSLRGDVERAVIEMLLRDFEETTNERRLHRLGEIKDEMCRTFPGLRIEEKVEHTYKNMRAAIEKYPKVTDVACKAIEQLGLAVKRKPIRGGTDGSKLSELNRPTPNLFTGGFLFHSRREWVALKSLVLATRNIIEIGRLWVEEVK